MLSVRGPPHDRMHIALSVRGPPHDRMHIALSGYDFSFLMDLFEVRLEGKLPYKLIKPNRELISILWPYLLTILPPFHY